MQEIDLWENEPDWEEVVASVLGEQVEADEDRGSASGELKMVDDSYVKVNLPWGQVTFSAKSVDVPEGFLANIVHCSDKEVEIHFKYDPSSDHIYDNLSHLSRQDVHGGVILNLSNTPLNALCLKYLLPKETFATELAKGLLKKNLKLNKKPVVELTNDGRQVEIFVPKIKFYKEIPEKLGSYPLTSGGYRLPLDKVMELEQLIATKAKEDPRLPVVEISDDVLNINREPIPGFTGDINSLKVIPVSVLNIVANNIQSWKDRNKNSKSAADNLAAMGINSLYDLLFWLPRRYIDKSNPQEVYDLLTGESATVLGKIKKAINLPNNKGVKFTLETDSNELVDVIFWNQMWLKNKYAIGSEVIVTGRMSWYMGKPNVSGASIDHSEEVALLPIVPVYNQSPTKGITTRFLLAAIRELVMRLGDFEFPDYFKLGLNKDEKYSSVLNELHFPSSLELHEKAVDLLAYYELVLMQVQMDYLKGTGEKKQGVVQEGKNNNSQKLAIKGFPWELTNSQKSAVKRLNKLMAGSEPARVLLNSDVGTGKTVVAQLVALRAFDSGMQAVLAAPTEVLARQIYNSFKKLVAQLPDDSRPVIELIVSGVPVKERNAIKRGIKDGSVHILVGTHSVLGSTIEYKDLGLVVIDEQQKFGAKQRTEILERRGDGGEPDLLMQSATPIPRSMAQVFYGEMEMIALEGKPEGRKPVVTEWIVENPSEIVKTAKHRVWDDIKKEAAKGNQTFVVTPLVSDSAKFDAASVESSFADLKKIFGLRVCMIHGQMKIDDQRKTMEDFRNKVYDVLVASSVVEVGVDIPDTTRVVILSADRFGASSLHQIRGRAGRNSKQSKCYLVSLGKTKSAQVRLQAMVDFTDGFEVAKIDLESRGAGNIFNTNQSGASDLIFASLAKHSEKIPAAKDLAQKIKESGYYDLALADANEKFKQEQRLA